MSLRRYALLLAATAPAGCTQPPEASTANDLGSVGAPDVPVAANQQLPTASPTVAVAKTEADYAGRWIGVEGMYFAVTARAGGGVGIDNQWDLDHQSHFDGVVTDEGLRFTRDGKTLVAAMSDGDATGLKYLAGKKDCLTVKSGEGYCRD